MFEYSEQFRSPGWGIILRLLVILIGAWLIGTRNLDKKMGGEQSDRTYNTHVVILTAVITFIVLFSAGMLRHMSFHSKAWDLAIFDQVIWNLANGNGWECSVRGVTDLRGDHFEPILLLFVPLYNIFPHVGWLLAAQAGSLVGTGLVIWSAYRKRIGYTAAMFFFIAFCLYSPIHWLALADFHPIALAPFFVAVAWWGRLNSKKLPFIVGIIGLSMCGEEGLLIAGWWGLWEFVVRKPFARRDRIHADYVETDKSFGWLGFFIMVVCWALFWYVTTKWIPAHRTPGEAYFYIHRYEYMGGSMQEIMLNFVLKPWRWISHSFDSRGLGLLAMYLVPLYLLPLLRPKTLLLLLPTIIYTLASVSDEQRSIFHQYTAMWIPFLAIATAEALVLPDILSTRPPTLRRALPLFYASLLGMLFFSPILGWSMHPEILTSEDWAPEARGLIQLIEPDQPVAAPGALCPHLSHRRELIWKGQTSWIIEGEVLVLPDYPPEGEGGNE